MMFGTIASAQVKSDYDKDADFSKYKTYSFAGWQKDSDQQLNDMDKRRIHDAFIMEFEARGMTLVENDADATVTLYIVLEDKTSVTAYASYNGAFGYRGGYGYGVSGPGMASCTTRYNEEEYRRHTSC